MGPREAIVAVTYRCNSRCVMCDIWRHEDGNDLEPAAYVSLPKSLQYINISGGEPFIRKDLVDIFKVIRRRCPRARILVSSNGSMPELIEKTVSQMPGVAVRISIDGIGEVHDRVRGVNGSFERAKESTERLKSLGIKDLGIAATITKENASQLMAVRRLAEEIGIEFTCAVAHSSTTYFGEQKDDVPDPIVAREHLKALACRQLSSSRPKDWFRAYFTSGLIDYVDGNARRINCLAGRRFFFVDPCGHVYPCNVLNMRMGNITEASFDDIQACSHDVLDKVKQCTQNCWMVCTVSPMMRRNPLRPLAWVLRAKASARLSVNGGANAPQTKCAP